MTTSKNLPFIVAGAVVIIGAIVVAAFRLYPVASVNGSFITSYELDQHYAATYQYYKKFIVPVATSSPDTPEFHRDLKKNTLDSLIEYELVRQELDRIFGARVASELLEKKIASAQAASLGTAVQELYDLNLKDFTAMIMVPAARNDLLAEQLFLEKQDMAEWLIAQRGKAEVYIFVPDLRWENGAVAVYE